MNVLARVVRGLEWVAADELTQLAEVEQLRLAPRQLEFSVHEITPTLTALRTVDDVFVEVGRIDHIGHTKEATVKLAAEVSELNFEAALATIRQVRNLDDGPFDVVASFDTGPAGRRNFNRFDIEDAVGPALAKLLNRDYVSRAATPDQVGQSVLTVRLVISDETAAVALRLAEKPLHRRAYKQAVDKASLHPPTAAALVRLASMPPGASIADPFCGDGTLAIEAALAHPDAVVSASDLDADRLANARSNAANAGMQIRFAIADAVSPLWREDSLDAVVMNPPWNLSVFAGGAAVDSFAPVWSEVRRGLRNTGVLCVLADSYLELADSVPGHLFTTHLQQRIRLAGRVCEIGVFSPSDVDSLSPSLRTWQATNTFR